MLLGRDRERQGLAAALESARRGTSAVLLLVGEPGIGKTALLDDAAAAAPAGMRVLRARGVESEAKIPFAGLLELLRPVLGELDRVPGPQAGALAGALALQPATAPDRFAVGAATLSLLAAAAETAPLAVLVDDGHWLDQSSAQAILFAARRLIADPIAVVVALRAGEPSPLADAALPVLPLAGLDRAATTDLLAARGGIPPADDVAERLHRATGGNPLALIELAGHGAALAWEPAEAPVPVSERIGRSFLRRAEALPAAARDLLLLAAASDVCDVRVLGRAADVLGLDVADLAASEDADLVRVRGTNVEFAHPLIRSAIYAAAPAAERRAAHHALAAVLPDLDVDRRAWHQAAAAVGTDDRAAAALEQAGNRARARSAYAVAAAAYERAAGLSTDEARVARLLLAAADASWLAGAAEQAVRLLAEARRYAGDGVVAAEIDHLGGHIAVRQGRMAEGQRLLVAAADATAGTDGGRAVVMLAEATNAAYYAGDAAAMLETGRRAERLLPPDAEPEIAFFAELAHGMALVFNGEGEPGTRRIRHAVELLEGSENVLDAQPQLLAWATLGPLWLREAPDGRSLADRALESARRHAAIGILPFLLMHVARDHAGSDRWDAAATDYHEGIRLARESGQLTDLAILLAGLAWLEARRGEEEACRRHAADAIALADDLGPGPHEMWALAALGELELGLGRPDAAVEHLEALDALLARRGVRDADLSPKPELVEAYLRLGRRDEAEAAAGAYAPQAREKGQPWAVSRAERSFALLAGEDGFEAHFEAALALLAKTPDVFAAARTELAYGARLRRARHRSRAREHLRAAETRFEQLGAAPWLHAATSELAATGETARRRDISSRDQLTPQELQIGLLLADGRTTREAAAALFLSPKTIEYHLRNAYRKLDIGSREELAASLRQAR